MNLQIERTIGLIKKAYDQPILFHILYSHLSFLLTKTNPLYEMTDDWSKIIIFSCSKNTIPNQGLEIKIQSFLKRIRPPLYTDEAKLKLMIICYYLLNRPSHLINHTVLFDLVSNFLGFSEYFDGLILNIFSRSVACKIYDLKENKKMSQAAYNRMLEIILEKNISACNKVKSLVLFISSDIKPFDLNFVEIKNDFLSYKMLECICLYAKYTQNTSYIKGILPSHPDFIESLSSFMNNNFEVKFDNSVSLKDCLVEDRKVFDYLRNAYEMSSEKKKFVSDVIEFLMGLE